MNFNITIILIKTSRFLVISNTYNKKNKYRIHGTFGGDLNLAVWQIWFQSPNFMSANSDYNQTIPFMSVFINPICQTKCPPICITFQFAKLNVHQMYRVYGILQQNRVKIKF